MSPFTSLAVNAIIEQKHIGCRYIPQYDVILGSRSCVYLTLANQVYDEEVRPLIQRSIQQGRVPVSEVRNLLHHRMKAHLGENIPEPTFWIWGEKAISHGETSYEIGSEQEFVCGRIGNQKPSLVFKAKDAYILLDNKRGNGRANRRKNKRQQQENGPQESFKELANRLDETGKSWAEENDFRMSCFAKFREVLSSISALFDSMLHASSQEEKYGTLLTQCYLDMVRAALHIQEAPSIPMTDAMADAATIYPAQNWLSDIKDNPPNGYNATAPADGCAKSNFFPTIVVAALAEAINPVASEAFCADTSSHIREGSHDFKTQVDDTVVPVEEMPTSSTAFKQQQSDRHDPPCSQRFDPDGQVPPCSIDDCSSMGSLDIETTHEAFASARKDDHQKGIDPDGSENLNLFHRSIDPDGQNSCCSVDHNSTMDVDTQGNDPEGMEDFLLDCLFDEDLCPNETTNMATGSCDPEGSSAEV